MQTLPPISMLQVNAHDPCLEREIPLLGIEQGRAHDTCLPDRPALFPQIADNFRMALQKKYVEIWRIDGPAAGCGAVFLSPLQKGGENGVQIDDIVVLPEHRGQGLGAAMLCFTAALAQERGLSFVAWECEENNPAQKTYRQVGAAPRPNVKPFRITLANIHSALAAITDQPAIPDTATRFTVSSRFSLFRTVNYGIDGYDMDPSQGPAGLQIEDISFDDTQDAFVTLCRYLGAATKEKNIAFADLVVPDHSPAHLELVGRFNAGQNSYSGNPAFLWELYGSNFEQAARRGATIPVLSL